jgi:Alpha/beta hydrolase of unknown function (DUF900)
MRVNEQGGRSVRILINPWIIAICCASGCYSPQSRSLDGSPPALIVSADSAPSAQVVTQSVGTVILESPRAQPASTQAEMPSHIETWIVHTRACEQKMGSDPWPSIAIGRLDEKGEPLHGTDPEALLARMTGRPSVFFIHGNGYTFRDAVNEAIRIRAILEANGGLPPQTVFVVFDWPSERVLPNLILDLNEKARRSRVASYHFARFLQTAPPGSRVCLLGQSDGGRIVLTTMHLLSGAPLAAFWSEPEVQLSSGRTDLRLRAVVLEAAAGHHWLNPDERLHQALPVCESLLNIRNCADYALAGYIFGVYTGLRPALGQVGFLSSDMNRLGPLSARVKQINLYPQVGISHTTFSQALDLPEVAKQIAHYTSWADVLFPERR